MNLMKLWEKHISRRSFLKASGVATGTMLFLSGCNQSKGDDVEADSITNVETASAKTENVTVVPTACYMCAIYCGAKAVVGDEGRVLRIEPNKKDLTSGGGLCPKGNSGVQLLYDADRLKYPMKKTGPYQWEKISWDEAFDTIYEKLTDIKEKYGPETLILMNRRGHYASLLKGFASNYGTPNGPFGSGSICEGGKRVGNKLVLDNTSALADYKNSKYIILMGANQMEAPRYRLAFPKEIIEAKRNGAKLVVVDPRFAYSSAKADEYLPITPGTDAALLMGMAHVIIKENIYDKEFVENYGQGFDVYKKEVLKDKYKPENVEKITGIAAETIIRIAREFATAESAVVDSSSGLYMWSNAVQNQQALQSLNALVGSICKKGGMVYPRGGKTNSIEFTNNVTEKKYYAQAGYPSYKGNPHDGNRNIFPAAILTPEAVPAGPLSNAKTASVNNGNGIKAAIIYNTEPVGAQMNGKLTKEAMEKLEFGIVIDLYLTQTAEALPVGGIVLPECTYLERTIVNKPTSFVPYLNINQKVVEPQWESKSGHWIFVKLGKRFGYEDFMAMDENDEVGAARDSIAGVEQADGSFADWDELIREGVWIGKDTEPKYGNYDKLKDGKFQFALVGELDEVQELYLKAGGGITAEYVEPKNRPSKEYPLYFMAGGKVIWHTQTSTRNIPYLMQCFDKNAIVKDTNYLIISPADAEERGIKSGDRVLVRSKTNEVEVETLVSERVPKGYTHMTHGFGHDAPTLTLANNNGANSSLLVDEKRMDLANCLTAKEETCQVYKI
ncbi:molybdopterin-containing oxidoreductase family protein [Alkaliphilus sp. B6464]|uniref:molybdopterin-containing oxidoreductase family protein n=1 Tax=Alkaliphilus sp. B6464 TaxID=2731219 RepID=UPI001BA71BE6|nr:molybdopterin-dependent oxidoreductase [Alkaliphilus sp. B6464]QUH21182.1 molybdopterin-dependent oxidoreductase [Alkaliphilus sp. B6464]